MMIGPVLHALRATALLLLYVLAVLAVAALVGIGRLMQKLYSGQEIIEDPEEGNCVSYAIPRWLEAPRSTYLLIRLSLSNLWPHVFFVQNIRALDVEEYQPCNRLHGWKSWFHAVWYAGRVRKGKGEEKHNPPDGI